MVSTGILPPRRETGNKSFYFWDYVFDKQKKRSARVVRLADESGGQPPQSRRFA